MRTLKALTLVVLLAFAAPASSAAPAYRVLNDLSHEFTFNVAGVRKCLGNARVTSTLASIDAAMLAPYDAVVTSQFGDTPATYSPQYVGLMQDFVRRGGGLLILASGKPGCSAIELARAFGLDVVKERVDGPFAVLYQDGTRWNPLPLKPSYLVQGGTPLVVGAGDRPVAALISYGRGTVIACGTGSLVSKHPPGPEHEALVYNVGALMAYLCRNKIGNRALPLPKTDHGYVPPEKIIRLNGFVFRYPATLPAERIAFLQGQLPRVYKLVTQQFGYSVPQTKQVWALVTGAGGFTASSRLVAIGATARDVVVVSILIHEMSNSLCVDTPVWMGDGGWSKIVQIRVKRKMGGQYAADADRAEANILDACKKWEARNGPYDIVTGRNWDVGEGRLLMMIRELEGQYGAGLMQRYFAAVRSPLGKRLREQKVPAEHRVLVYFNRAAGTDLSGWFRRRGVSLR